MLDVELLYWLLIIINININIFNINNYYKFKKNFILLE